MQAATNFSEAEILQIPYDLGRRNFRMGNGPAHLVQEIAKTTTILTETISVEERPFELGTAVRIWRSASDKISGIISHNRLPIVLAGGCLNSLAALSAIGPESTGVIWFDSHGDFNTPETTPSGFLDGMALAAITGRCWHNLTASVPGFRPVPEKNVLQIGARDLDAEELSALEASEITSLSPEFLRNTGIESAVLAALSKLPQRVYLHIDLDVLDREEACVNEYSSSGGLTVSELLTIIRLIGRNRIIVGAAFTAYDPSVDHDSKALQAGVAAIKELLAAACIGIS